MAAVVVDIAHIAAGTAAVVVDTAHIVAHMRAVQAAVDILVHIQAVQAAVDIVARTATAVDLDLADIVRTGLDRSS